ncbi:hypothetical protein [Nocardioides deserti]|nr:hypothetical protein [Nocardioides deserti]
MRILEAADPAAAVLVKLALNLDGHTPHNIQLAAARDILDRNGIGNSQTVEVLLKPWEKDIEGVLVDAPDDHSEIADAELVADEEPRFLPAPRDWDGRTADNVPPTYTRGDVQYRSP